MFLLSIAGYDPSGGAGILVDLKVFSLLKFKGGGIPTALTLQNTTIFEGWKPVKTSYFQKALSLIFSDLPVKGIKLGMLATLEHAEIIVHYLKKYHTTINHIVFDPVLKATLNYPLFDSTEYILYIKQNLLPLVEVIIPNFEEAKILTAQKTENVDELGKELLKTGVKAVIITGIKKTFKNGIFFCDHCFIKQNSQVIKKIIKKKAIKGEFHGTGCAFSSALLCFLIKGFSLEHSFKKAKNWLYLYLKKAERERLGGKLWLFL
jgi:hydroxymethylpyrimidine/phosphomethylpyrimidine kinase